MDDEHVRHVGDLNDGNQVGQGLCKAFVERGVDRDRPTESTIM
jgi:hypothetical protein